MFAQNVYVNVHIICTYCA